MSRWTIPLACAAPERAAALEQDVGDPLGRERALTSQDVREVLALQVLHDEVARPVRGRPEVGDVDDVLMPDTRRALGLLPKALDDLGTAREVLAQDLHGDTLLDDGVLGLVDQAHPALADPADDLVFVERQPDERIVALRLRMHLGVRDQTRGIDGAKHLASAVLGLADWADLLHGSLGSSFEQSLKTWTQNTRAILEGQRSHAARVR